MLQIAMLSFAHVHARGYAQHIVQHPEAHIACVWDDLEARGQAAADALAVPYDDDLERVLGRSDIDAVVVNAPTNRHRDVLLAAVAQGKHIFTEKALTVTLEDAEAVTRAVQASDVKFMISLPSRTRPETLFARQALDKGWLGDVTLMRARIAHSAALDRWFKAGTAWFGDAVQAGGGSLFDLGCHTADVMRWFLGPPAHVSARIQNFAQAYDIDDQAVAVVEFAAGALGILDVSWVQRAGPNRVEIFGTEGFLGWDAPAGQVELQSAHPDAQGLGGVLRPALLPAALPLPMDQWIDAILRDGAMTIAVDDGRNLTELLDGIYRAARTDRGHAFG